MVSVLQIGKNEGFVSDKCLPFDSTDGKTCDKATISKCKDSQKVESWCLRDSVYDIKREIITNGPVISVMVMNRELYAYGGGIFDVEESKCPRKIVVTV